jgi:probable HAF family extracellular repeat protein
MKTTRSILMGVIVLFTALALPSQLAAQHTRYKLIDLGTLGGPAGWIAQSPNGGPENPGRALTGNGMLVGAADTATADPNCFLDCFFIHAFRLRDGALVDLGTLQGNDPDSFSMAQWINDRGWIAGWATIGGIDPLSGFPATHAVLWRNGNITDLGALGEDFSQANALNNHGKVVGFSLNGQPDPFPIFGNPTQNRAFLWQKGVMHDLGTLCESPGVCGLDANAFGINESGQVAGISSTNTTPNADTGIPTVRPFLWDRGRMIDLGTLGGTLSAVDGPAIVMNNRGQVGGTSTLSGDQTYHPFLWERGVMKDLGTLGGDTGFVTWITDSGDLIGTADLPGPPGSQSHHAFLWRIGVKTDLGSLGGSSHAEGINSQGQIVGRSKPTPDSSVQHAFLWENGGPMVDLNTLIPPNSPLLLEEGGNINDRGEIAGRGLPSGCDDVDACGHVFLLIPCGNNPSCNSEANVATAASQQPIAVTSMKSAPSTQARRTLMSVMSAWRERLAQRYPGLAHKDW